MERSKVQRLKSLRKNSQALSFCARTLGEEHSSFAAFREINQPAMAPVTLNTMA